MPGPRRPRWQQQPLILPASAPANDVAAEVAALDAFVGELPSHAGCAPANDGPSATRVAAGRKAHRDGDAFECFVRSYLGTAVAAGAIAWWAKIHAGVEQRRVRCTCGAWRFELVWGERAAADFVGLLPDGRMLAIECKSVRGTRLAASAIQPHQAGHLAAVAVAGGHAILAVEFADEGRATRAARQYFIPWHLVPWETARTARSLSEAAAAPWREHAGAFLSLLNGARGR